MIRSNMCVRSSRQNSRKHTSVLFGAVGLITVMVLAGCPWCAPDPIVPISPVPKTGQTVSYASGDDGDLQMGIAWPVPRFVDNSDGTVTDRLTGLMWDGAGTAANDYWAQVLIAVGSMSLGGQDDWRVPNNWEMRSLVNPRYVDTSDWLNNLGVGFSGLGNSNYWTSTTYQASSGYAYSVRMGNSTGYASNKTDSQSPVRAVRGGSGGTIALPKTGQTTTHANGDDGDSEIGLAWPNPRFVDNQDGTLTDLVTGLMWDQDANRFNGTWTSGLSSVAALTLGGHDDWRMPNVNEMISLANVSYDYNSDWLTAVGFSNVQAADYWTSTTYANITSNAWLIATFDNNWPNDDDKNSSHPVIAVRGPDG